jgi:hypothetical protein
MSGKLHADGRRLTTRTTTAEVLRSARRRSAFARVVVGIALLVLAAVLWLLIVSLWAEVAGRAIPPVLSASVAPEPFE